MSASPALDDLKRRILAEALLQAAVFVPFSFKSPRVYARVGNVVWVRFR